MSLTRASPEVTTSPNLHRHLSKAPTQRDEPLRANWAAPRSDQVPSPAPAALVQSQIGLDDKSRSQWRSQCTERAVAVCRHSLDILCDATTANGQLTNPCYLAFNRGDDDDVEREYDRLRDLARAEAQKRNSCFERVRLPAPPQTITHPEC